MSEPKSFLRECKYFVRTHKHWNIIFPPMYSPCPFRSSVVNRDEAAWKCFIKTTRTASVKKGSWIYLYECTTKCELKILWPSCCDLSFYRFICLFVRLFDLSWKHKVVNQYIWVLHEEKNRNITVGQRDRISEEFLWIKMQNNECKAVHCTGYNTHTHKRITYTTSITYYIATF